MKKIISIIVLTIIISILICNIVYARASVHSSVRSTPKTTTHSSTHSSSTHSSTKVTGAKTYTTPKNFTSKYNASNIKTEKVNPNPESYKNFSTTNIFRPNFWTAMWAFQCINNNGQATEQDIAKELEERGYTEEEIKEILAEGEEAKKQVEEEEKNNTKIAIIVGIIGIAIIIIAVIIIIRS